VKERFARGDMILVFQLLTGLLKVDPNNYFTLAANQTRGHSLKLRGLTSRVNVRKNFFTERVVNPWNSLPNHVVTAPTLNLFKQNLDNWRQ
jgi:hypothetical protein